jgi:hypothetical protein
MVNAYQTTDGELHTCKAAAAEHQNHINAKAAIREWCEEHFCSSQNFLSDIEEAMIKDRVNLLKALGGDLS